MNDQKFKDELQDAFSNRVGKIPREVSCCLKWFQRRLLEAVVCNGNLRLEKYDVTANSIVANHFLNELEKYSDFFKVVYGDTSSKFAKQDVITVTIHEVLDKPAIDEFTEKLIKGHSDIVNLHKEKIRVRLLHSCRENQLVMEYDLRYVVYPSLMDKIMESFRDLGDEGFMYKSWHNILVFNLDKIKPKAT
jgi:hypothetical protein